MNASKRVAILSGLSVFLLGTMLLAGEKQIVRFPGKETKFLSPNGRYVLINVDSIEEKDVSRLGDNHALYLRDLKHNKEDKIYSYGRYVDVLWSLKGGWLLINDHGGSDYTNSIIFPVSNKGRPVDVKEELRKREGDNKSIFGNHHVYIEGTEWLSENRLKIRVSGYGDVDPGGFTLWYEYVIGDGFKKTK